MHQELQLARADGSGPAPSVDDVVFKRTYNADGPLYKDLTGTNYYFVFNNSIQIINPANMTFRSICELDGKQELQVLGSFKLVSLNPKDRHIGDSDSDWKVAFVAVDRATTSKPVVPNRCG
jgi:hypothetical protein